MNHCFSLLLVGLSLFVSLPRGEAQTITPRADTARIPILDSLLILDRGVYYREFYKDGMVYKQFNDSGLVVTANVVMAKDYFKIFRVEVHVDNCSGERLTVLDGCVTARIVDGKKEHPLKVYRYGEYYTRANRFESFMRWAQISGDQLNQLTPASSLRIGTDGGVSYSAHFRTRTLSPGVYRASEADGTLSSMDENLLLPRAYRAIAMESDARLRRVETNYLRSVTLEDGQLLAAFVAVEREKGDRLEVTFTLGAKCYHFAWMIDESMILSRHRNKNMLLLMLL